MKLSTLAYLALANAVASTMISTSTAEEIFQFGQLVEIENSFIQPNGKLLFTTPSPSAQLWQVDPSQGNITAKLVSSFDSPSALAVHSISDSRYAVTTGQVVAGPSGVVGSFSLHVLDVSDCGQASLVKTIPVADAKFLNKMVPLHPGSDVMLVGDSQKSRIYAVDTASGDVQVVLQDDATMGSNASVFPVGINGLQRVGPFLYYVNSSKGTLNRVMLGPDGQAVGDFEVVADFSDTVKLPDDFAVLPNGEAFIAGSNQILQVSPDGSYQSIAGGINDKTFAGATSARLDQAGDSLSLYITTSGHISSPSTVKFVEPGKILKVDLQYE